MPAGLTDSGLATHVSKDKAQCTLLKESVHSDINVTSHVQPPMGSYLPLGRDNEYEPAGFQHVNIDATARAGLGSACSSRPGGATGKGPCGRTG